MRQGARGMNEQEILAGLGEIVEEIAGVPADEVTPSKSFVDDLDIDSLSMVEIAVAAQDKFGVEIPDDELKNLKTVRDVIDYVRRAEVSAWSPGSLAAVPRRSRHRSEGADEECGQTSHVSWSPASARPRRSAATCRAPGRAC